MFHPSRENKLLGGIQRIYTFENGYGASVVCHRGSYSSRGKKWELAVIGQDDELCYTTPITSDVIGHLSDSGVQSILAQINNL